MTVTKGFLIIILSALTFALGGAAIGYTLSVFLPGYYRAVYRSGDEPWFDPIQVGVGLGVARGLICGLIVGAIVMLAVAWSNSRRDAWDVKPKAASQGDLNRPLADQASIPVDASRWEQVKTEAIAKSRK